MRSAIERGATMRSWRSGSSSEQLATSGQAAMRSKACVSGAGAEKRST